MHQLQKVNMPPRDREVLRKLMQEYGLKHLQSESKFYRLYKVTRADFLAQIEKKQSAGE